MKTMFLACLFTSIVYGASPRIDLSLSGGGTVNLSFSPASGQETFFERSTDCKTWTALPQVFRGNGTPVLWHDAPGPGSRFFYRLKANALMAQRFYGIDFDAYMDGQSPQDRTVISRSQIEQRMRTISAYTDWVRTYRTVDGYEVAGQVAHELGLKIAMGAWLGPETTQAEIDFNHANIDNLITAANNGEADLAIVGSEVLLRHNLTPSQLAGYITQVRNAVPSSVMVATADTYNQFDPKVATNAVVVSACDALMVNIFPFWESTAIDEAMPSVHAKYFNTKVFAKGKPVIISEAGWPSAGSPRGAAVPSQANATDFCLRFASWARSSSVPFFYFEALDESWKSVNEGDVGPNWGLKTKAGVLKSGIQSIFDASYAPANWNAPIDGAGVPAISFTSVPAKGTGDTVSGTVSHVAPYDVLVTVYVKVGGNWWGPKPFSDNPWVAVSSTGTWTTKFVSGGNDVDATDIAAFVLPKAFTPPGVGNNAPDLPGSLVTNALASTTVSR